MAGHGTGFNAVNDNFARIHVIKTHKQVDQRRFAAARRADDCNAHSAFYLKRKIADQLRAGRVGKTNIAEADIAGAFSLFIALSRVRRSGGIDFRRGVDKLKQPRRTGKRALQFRNDSGNFVERLCVLVGIA